jgi:hypothetical protein
MVAKECNAGLRLINSNYTSDGTGRDCMMFFDAGYRGGKVLMNNYGSHQNHSTSAPYPEKVPADKLWNKLGMRPYDNTSRYAALTKNVKGLAESRKYASMPTLPSEDFLFTKKQPNAPFQRTVGLASTGTLRIPPEPEVEEPKPIRLELAKGDLHRHQYMGIARTPYGGFWRTMSRIGPG